MRNFQDTFETRQRSFISAFSMCISVPLIILTASEFQLIAAIYVREYISENLFFVLSAIVSTQKKFDDVNLAIRES